MTPAELREWRMSHQPYASPAQEQDHWMGQHTGCTADMCAYRCPNCNAITRYANRCANDPN